MKTPRKIRIGYAVYSVTEDPDMYALTGAAGATGVDEQAIRIAPSLAHATKRQVLLHEVGHAVWNQTLLDRTVSDRQEENVLWAFIPILFQVFRDNPKFVEWLMEKEEG